MRRASSVLAAAAMLASGAAFASRPPVRSTGVDIFGQPERSAEVSGRPLARSLALFRSKLLAARLPAPPAPARPLAVVAAQLRGDPGALLLAGTRGVATPVGRVYLVPTRHGWVCVQGPRFETCHQGLLRQGITWNFYSADGGLDVIGIAADDVARVALTFGKRRRRAELEHNVFFVRRPIALTSARHLPPLGRLVVTYRGSKPPSTVALR